MQSITRLGTFEEVLASGNERVRAICKTVRSAQTVGALRDAIAERRTALGLHQP